MSMSNPRVASQNVAEPAKDLYFRIFLKCCFQGDRFGHPHEVGLTNKCMWCGFEFPTNPTVMDTDTEGKAALLTQDVKTDEAEFTELLDSIHRITHVNKVVTPVFPSTNKEGGGGGGGVGGGVGGGGGFCLASWARYACC